MKMDHNTSTAVGLPVPMHTTSDATQPRNTKF